MKNKKRGFTIVELVIVIAVIGILSAIMIPTFAGLTSKANETKLQQEISGVYTTFATEYEPEDGELLAKDEVIVTKAALTLSAEEGHVGEITFTTENNAEVYVFVDGKWAPIAAGTYKLVKHTAEKITGYDVYSFEAVV